MKTHSHIAAASAEAPNTRQRLFTRYLMSILVDLVVLNLVAEYWARVTVDSFSTSLIVALLLQLLLQLTFALEHRVGSFFRGKKGAAWTTARFASAWVVLFISKLIMLGVLDRLLGDAIHFAGPMHGAGAFILLVVAMLGAEELTTRIYRALRD